MTITNSTEEEMQSVADFAGAAVNAIERHRKDIDHIFNQLTRIEKVLNFVRLSIPTGSKKSGENACDSGVANSCEPPSFWAVMIDMESSS